MTLTGFEPSSANCATTTALRYDACCLSSTRRPFNIFRLSQHEKGVLTLHIISSDQLWAKPDLFLFIFTLLTRQIYHTHLTTYK